MTPNKKKQTVKELQNEIKRLNNSSRINKNMGTDEFNWCIDQLELIKTKMELVNKIPTKQDENGTDKN